MSEALPEGAGTGALAAGAGTITPSVPRDATPEQIERHLETILFEYHAISPDDHESRRSLSEEIEMCLEALPDDRKPVLSALRRDLDMIDGHDEPTAPEAPADIAARVAQAFVRREFVPMREMLREWPPAAGEDVRAFVRAQAWSALGFRLAAVAFFEHASGLSKHPRYQAALLDALVRAGRILEASERAASVLERADDARLLLKALQARFLAVRYEPRHRRRQAAEGVLGAIEATVQRIGTGAIVRHPSALAEIEVLRGFVLRNRLGRPSEARQAFNRAVEIDPSSEAARVARGTHELLHGSADAAAEDLKAAVDDGTAIVPAYGFLAWTLLQLKRYEECESVCERGLRLPVLPSLRAALLEMRAFAHAERGLPIAESIGWVREAARLVPSNERTKGNLRLFERASADPAAVQPTWQPGDLKPDLELLEQELTYSAAA